MAIESLYAESQVSTTILRKRAYLDGYAARLVGSTDSTQIWSWRQKLRFDDKTSTKY